MTDDFLSLLKSAFDNANDTENSLQDHIDYYADLGEEIIVLMDKVELCESEFTEVDVKNLYTLLRDRAVYGEVLLHSIAVHFAQNLALPHPRETIQELSKNVMHNIAQDGALRAQLAKSFDTISFPLK